MKRFFLLILALFLVNVNADLGFADKKVSKEEKDKKSILEYKRKLADCMSLPLETVYYEDLDPDDKEASMSVMYDNVKHKLFVMETDPEYKKEHIKCYKTLKRAKAELGKLLKKN